jgi:hypothetical protein
MSSGIKGALEAGFDALPDLPPDIKEQLKPYLEAIESSGSTEELNTNTSALNAFVDTLPEDIQAMLKPALEAVGISITGTGEVNLGTLNGTIATGNEVMQNVVDNTGEDGPIVRELKRIGGTGDVQAAGASATVEFGNTEATDAMQKGFFDQTINVEDLYGGGTVDTSNYAEEESNRGTATGAAVVENTAAASKASQKAADEMEKVCAEIQAMHATLALQTKRLTGLLNDQMDEAAKARREARLNKK